LKDLSVEKELVPWTVEEAKRAKEDKVFSDVTTDLVIFDIQILTGTK